MPREYIKGTWEEEAAFSPVVITRGGRILWVAGHGATRDDKGQSLAGNFEAQVHHTFKNIEATLKRAGGKLQDIVTMTVFTLDVRHRDLFLKLRQGYFADGFPASALITVAGFADPDMMIEIQAVAVIEED